MVEAGFKYRNDGGLMRGKRRAGRSAAFRHMAGLGPGRGEWRTLDEVATLLLGRERNGSGSQYQKMSCTPQSNIRVNLLLRIAATGTLSLND